MRHRQKKANTVSTPRNVSLTNNALPCWEAHGFNTPGTPGAAGTEVLHGKRHEADGTRERDAARGRGTSRRSRSWRGDVGALPNGKKAGMPFSENQSPTYGADKNGITALLKSVSKLPFDRAFGGGLNLTFSKAVSPEILRSLVAAYFDLGGQHVGVTVLDKDTLRDAMAHPEKYQSLTVRLYGFSEYFVSLPPWQQLAVLNRTEY